MRLHLSSIGGYPVFPGQFVEDIFSPVYVFGAFVKNWMAVAVGAYL
jgi:hypothetical protein